MHKSKMFGFGEPSLDEDIFVHTTIGKISVNLFKLSSSERYLPNLRTASSWFSICKISLKSENISLLSLFIRSKNDFSKYSRKSLLSFADITLFKAFWYFSLTLPIFLISSKLSDICDFILLTISSVEDKVLILFNISFFLQVLYLIHNPSKLF